MSPNADVALTENSSQGGGKAPSDSRQHFWISLIRILVPLIAVVAAMVLGGVIILLSGGDPILAYKELFKGAFGNTYRIAEIVVRAIPLAFAGLAVALSFNGGLINIGAEGQLYAGALGSGLVALSLPNLAPVPLMILSVLAGFCSGAVWGAIPGVLKAKWNINEFVNTVMMNYIAIYLLLYLVSGPVQADDATLRSPPLSEASWLPIVLPKTRLHLGVFLLLVVAVGVFILLRKTVLGYQIRVMGSNPRAALYAGMGRFKITVINLTLAGAIAGLGGAVEVLGVQHRFQVGLSSGYGYTGITVALLGRNNAFGVIVASLFFGLLRTGSRAMESYSGVNIYVISIIEAFMLIAVLSSDFMVRKLQERREKSE